MLQASKAKVVTGFHLDALNIRQAELSYFLMVFSRLQEIASFLGFSASAALSINVTTTEENQNMKAFFLVATTTCFGSFFCVLMISSMCTMWGPGKALRGDNAASMDYALYVLEHAHQLAIRFTFLGLVCFLFAAVLLVWLLFAWKGSVPASVVLMGFMGVLLQKLFRIYMALQSGKTVSSALRGNLVKDVGELMGDHTLEGANGGISTRFANHV
eukprot:g11195.t1